MLAVAATIHKIVGRQPAAIIGKPNKAPVAQLDRVPGFEPGGREFESLRARIKNKGLTDFLC